MRTVLTISMLALAFFALATLNAQTGGGKNIAPVATASASAPVSRVVRSITGPVKEKGLEVYTVDSDYQKSPAKLYALLPDNFDKNKRYKVLYILPCWGPSNEGIIEARKLGLANKHDVICVNPDYVSMCWYADHPTTPKMLYDSYLPEMVVPFIDKTYPTVAKPEGRTLIGYSKGGLGAMTELLRHPEVFGRAGAWDSPVMQNNTHTEFYGPQEYFMANYYIPDLLTRNAGIFKGKPARFAIAGKGFGAEPGNIKQCSELMTKLEIPHYCDDTIRPDHDWRTGWFGPLVGVLMAEDMTKVGPIGPMSPATRPAKTTSSSSQPVGQEVR